jgi:DNA-binding NtrC family response regulator
MSRGRVLVADDKESMLSMLENVLGDHFDVTVVNEGRRAVALALAGDFDVVLTDIRMPGADGFEVLQAVKSARPEVEVVLMTAFGSVQKAVEAIKAGAYDYLAKPFEPEDAVLTIERAVERKRLRQQTRDLKAALDGAQRFDHLVGRSPAMQAVFALLERAAATDATLLITGERGTGKELVARAVHAKSSRSSQAFITFNCGAVPEALIESELFGHVQLSPAGATSDRAGPFELASGGTLLLDEVGSLPLPLQVKLTRVLQERRVSRIGETNERPVDVRIIAATNLDLRRAVTEGRFREDLFYRLNILHVELPPLRERSEDIPLLLGHFLDLYRARYASRVEGFTSEALEALVRYEWPGNVRELENAVERALAVVDAPRVPLEALPGEIASSSGRPRLSASLASLTFREVIELARDRASREYLVLLMQEFGGNVTKAAERAGVERESLHRLLKRYGLRSNEFKPGD